MGERGDAVLIKHKDGLLNVNLGAAVRVNDIGKAAGHCGVPAVNTAASRAPVALVFVGIHGFATNSNVM